MIDDLNLDGLVEPVSAPPLNVSGLVQPQKPATSHLPDLMGFLWSRNLTPGSTTGGKHNLGSLHYSGNAIDIKGSGAFSDAQVAALKQDAASRGFLIRDERVRPPNQKVWGGPHVHIEYAGGPQVSNTQSGDGLNLDGLVEPLNVQGLVESAGSIVPPVPQQTPQQSLSLNDAAWHLSVTPDEWDALSPKQKQRAATVLDEAVAEDQRKRSLGQDIQQPSIQYQNSMRAKVGLPLKSLAQKYYNGADAENKPLGGNPLMPNADRSEAFAQDEARKQAETQLADRIRTAAKMGTPELYLLPKSTQEWIASALAQGTGDLTNLTAGIVRDLPVSGLTTAGPIAENVTKLAADKLNRVGNEISVGAQIMDKQTARSGLSQSAKDLLGGTIGSSPVYALMALGVPPPVAFGLHAYLMERGHDADLLSTLTETTKAATIGALFELPLPAKKGILNEVGRRLAKAGIVGGGTEALNLLQGRGAQSDALVNALFAFSGGKKSESIVPDVPGETLRIDTMPDIPDVPVGTISEPRVIKGEKNAISKGIEQQSSEQQYQGTSQGATVPEDTSQVRQVGREQAGNRDRVEGSGQVQQEALNVQGIVEQPNTVVPATSGGEVSKPEPQEIQDLKYRINLIERTEAIQQTDVGQKRLIKLRGDLAAAESVPQEVPKPVVVPQTPVEAAAEPKGTVPDVPQADRQTGIKNAVVEAERELQGLPQFQKARRTHGASFDEGVFDVQSGRIKPRELASDIVRAFYDPKFSIERFQSRRPRPLSTEESMALLYDRMRIATEQKVAETEFDAANQSGDETRIATAVDEVSRLQQASNANDEADYVSGGEQGRGLAIRREMIKDDFSRARVLSQAVARNKGKPLPAEVQAKLESTVEELAKAHARIADLESQQGRVVAESDVNKTIRQHQRALRSQGRQRTRQVIATERADIKQQIAAEFVRLKTSQSSTLSQGGLGSLDPEGRITKLVGQLARGYVEEGVTKAADLVEAVHGYIKDVADLTKREVQDLISGYGKTSQSKPDEIGKKLTEIRALLRVVSGKADVVEKGIRPLRSGFQRPKPSQELREATRDLRNTLREHGIEVERSARSPQEQQKSILDAAKTATRNRIEDLTKWIADGKRTVTGKTEIIPDVELKSLRAERDRLQTVFDAIKDPEADQKAVTRALGVTNKSILELESKIKSGNIAPKAKTAQLSSPELAAARTTQKTLQGILRDMRTAEKRANKPVEDPDITDARKVLAAQKAFMTRNRQRMVAMQGELALAQRGVKAEKAKREPLPLTDEMKVAQRNANQQRRNIDNIYAVIDWQNKTNLQKGLAYGAAGVRAGVLSGLKVLGKIGGALLQRIPQQYIEEGAGKGWARIYPDVAAKAPRHGAGINAATEAEFWRGLKSGALEIPSIIKTGESELSLEQGKRYPNIPTKIGTALAIPGRVHMAEKNILKVGEYNRSLEANLQWAERQGMDRGNPDVIEQAKERAYKDAEEIVLLGDNPFSRFLRNGRRSMSDEGRSLTRIVVPVERVPSNYLSQAIGDYGFGLIRGTIRALKARNPELLEKMTPEEADKTMRLLKRGSLGLVYTALASSGVIGFGGYWSQRKKGDKRDIAPNDVKIGPMTISHTWVHSPPVELAQFAATIKREIQSRSQKRESVAKKTLTGIAHGAKGLADQTPFLNQYTRIYDSFKSGDALEKKLGETLAGWIEPQIVKELAAATDREEKGKHTIIPWKGEAVQRKAKSFSDSLLVGLPVGREYVKKDRKKMVEIRRQERRGSGVPPVPGALNLSGLVEPSPSPTP